MNLVDVSDNCKDQRLENKKQENSADLWRVLTGASLVIIGVMANRVFDLVTRTVIARYLGPEGFGILSTSISILSIAGTFTLFGLSLGIVRFISKDQNHENVTKYFFVAFWFVTFVGGVIGLFAWIFDNQISVLIFRDPELSVVVQAIGISIPLFAALSIVTSVFQSFGNARAYVLINNIVLPGIRLLAVFCVLIFSWGFIGIVNGYLWIALAITLITAIPLSKKYALNFWSLKGIDFVTFELLARFSFPLLIGSLIGLSVWQIDVIFLQREWGSLQAGLYSAALTLGRLPNILLIAFGFMLAPIMAQQFEKKHLADLRRLYGQIIDLIFFIGLPISTAFVVFAPQILNVLFGNEYLASVTVLRIMAVGYFLHSILGPNGNTLIMIGRSKVYMIDTTISAIITIILYIIIIPVYGLIGAALATLGGLTIMNVLFSSHLFQITGINPFLTIRFRLIAIVTFAAFVSFIINKDVIVLILPEWLSLLIALILLAILYVSITIITGTIKPEELFQFKKLILRGKANYQ